MTLSDFLDLMHADLRNEWTHLEFYLYHASAVSGLHAAEYKEFLTKAANGELHHVQQFLDRLFGLNYKPTNVSGRTFPVATNPQTILAEAIKLENEVVKNYTLRLRQLENLAGAHPETAAYLTVFYEKQLEDSYEDCEQMRRLLEQP